MKIYTQTENVITVAAPAAVSSGDLVVVGGIVGVAQADAASGANVALVRRGVFDLPKQTGFAPSAGDPAYWSDANDRLEAAGARVIGVYAEDAVSGATAARVILDPALGERQVQVDKVFMVPQANTTTTALSEAPFDGTITGLAYYTDAKPASSAGTCVATLTKGGTTLLSTANVDAEAFTDDAKTALTLTGTAADLAVDKGDITLVKLISDNADLVPGAGVTFFVTYARD